MNHKKEKRIENFFQYFLLLIFIGLFLYIVYPFLFAILFALAIVISTYPIYNFILKLVRKPILTAFFMLFLLSVVIFLPLYVISIKLYQQGANFYQNSNSLDRDSLLNSCSYEFCQTLSNNVHLLSSYIDSGVSTFSQILQDSMYSIISSITSFGIQLFIFYVCVFYFYINKDSFLKSLKKLLPLKTQYKEALIIKFQRVCSAVFLDSILIAIMQGTLVGIGFYIFGLESGFIWAIIASFLALLPILGAAFIWGGAAIYLVLIGEIFSGIGLFLYGMLIVSTSDNLVRPLLLEKSIHIHPFLILLSIMGGIEIFGFIGIFYGPIIISMLVSLIDLYEIEFR